MRDSHTEQEICDKVVIMEGAPTYKEYLQANPCLAGLMRARQREIRLSSDDQLFFCTLPVVINMAVIASPDTPDTVAVVPVLARLARVSPRISFWVMDLETGMSLFERLVDDPDFLRELPDRELPLLVMLDAERNYCGQWGPHPQGFASHMAAWRERHPDYGRKSEHKGVDPCALLANELTHEMRLWYNSGLNSACVSEVRALLESWMDVVKETSD